VRLRVALLVMASLTLHSSARWATISLLASSLDALAFGLSRKLLTVDTVT
jgi:hypothetical protein